MAFLIRQLSAAAEMASLTCRVCADDLSKLVGSKDPLLSRRLIFSINAGRSGSNYLYRLLGTAKNAASFHHPQPMMAGRYVTRYRRPFTSLGQRLIYPAAYIKKYKKVLGIKSILKTLPADQVYAETSYMFILSFHDVVLDQFKNVQVIHLRRYLPNVLRSWAELGSFTPDALHPTEFWSVSPNNPTAAVRPLAPDKEFDRIDRCVAYLIDIEARAQRFRKDYPHIKVVEARVEDLNDWDHVSTLFQQLDLEPSDATKLVMGKVVHQRTDEKEKLASSPSRLPQEATEEYCMERIQSYIERCKAKGIELPDLPQLIKT